MEIDLQKSKLKKVHTAFLIQLVDDNACVTLQQAQHDLYNMFEGLTILISELQKYMNY